ncbi:MAG TPA: hypothetical protein VD837_09225 [Terriglobales bacterium]|nr:hypothetical protein [Terriglobales bacterium]
MRAESTTRSIGRRAPWAALVIVLSLVTLVSQHARAQAVWAQGGTSTMMSASGFQLDYRWAPVQGWLGFGFSDGTMVGGYVETKVRRFDVGFGDRYQPLTLSSDFFDGGRYFAGRGITVTRRGERETVTAFAGATADERSYNFFRAFDIQESTLALFYSRKFSRVSYNSFTIAQDKATSIHSLQFSPLPNLKASVAGGVGYNSRYASAGGEYETQTLRVAAAYTDAGQGFRRIGGVLTNAPEHVGANLRVRFQPIRQFGFSVAHENLLSPVTLKGEDALKVSMNSAGVFGSLAGFNLNASASKSSSGALHSRTQTFGASRGITRSISASGMVMRMALTGGTSTVLVGSVREKISPRLSLNQGISKQGNNNAFTFGGRFISNRITLGIQHDMIYSTLAGGFGRNPYMHMWSVNLNARLFRGVRIHADTMVDPTGRVRYTAWLDGIGFSRGQDQISGGPTQPVPSFSKFVVRGMVQDTEGKPVWGISVQVDGQNAFSDSTGRFFLRFRRGERYPVSIVPERSLNTQYYEVAEAPVSALAEPEDLAQPIVIVVRRAKNPSPRRRSELGTPEDPIVSGGGLAPESPEDAAPPSGGGLEPRSSLTLPRGTAPEHSRIQ